jgi:hypothetical protein
VIAFCSPVGSVPIAMPRSRARVRPFALSPAPYRLDPCLDADEGRWGDHNRWLAQE